MITVTWIVPCMPYCSQPTLSSKKYFISPKSKPYYGWAGVFVWLQNGFGHKLFNCDHEKATWNI